MSRNGGDPSNVEPWERQPGESDPRWEAFLVYRDQPQNGEDRSLRAVARTLNKSLTVVGHWSSEDGWRNRVASYDNHLEAMKQKAMGRELEATVRGQAQHLAAARAGIGQLVTSFLRDVAAANEAGRDPFEDWDLREKARTMTVALKALPAIVQSERTVIGLSTVNVGGHDGGALKHEATIRAESMTRSEAEAYLLGREDREAQVEVEGEVVEG